MAHGIAGAVAPLRQHSALFCAQTAAGWAIPAKSTPASARPIIRLNWVNLPNGFILPNSIHVAGHSGQRSDQAGLVYLMQQ